MLYSVFFFFSSRRRHTRCGRDWSSDVCSSDLLHGEFHHVSNYGAKGFREGDAAKVPYWGFLRPAALFGDQIEHSDGPRIVAEQFTTEPPGILFRVHRQFIDEAFDREKV